MNKRLGTPVAALLALALPAILAAQGRPARHSRYTLVDVGTLGGSNSFIIGLRPINEKGTVVGVSETAFDPDCDCVPAHAFRWDKGTLTDLGTLSNGSSLSVANAINSSGAIAGASFNGLNEPVTGTAAFVATIWTKKGEIVDLGTLGGSFSDAVDMNDRGMAVGGATNTILDPDNLGEALIGFPSRTQWHATMWRDGTIQDLGTLGDGPDSIAFFVNERGQVAGDSYTSSVPNPMTGIFTVAPFLWENGHMTNLGTLGGVIGGSRGLNNKGQVVGVSHLEGDQAEHAFLWEKGSILDLGTLGGNYSEAFAINEKGEVVGASDVAVDQAFHAFIWRHGVMSDLGTVVGDTFSRAVSINERGQVVGESFVDDDSGRDHAFLWEDGGPPIDLNVFVPPGSGMQLREAQFITNSGEIAGLASLPNGDDHVYVLIPKGEDASDEDAPSAMATGPDAAVHSPATVAHASLSPEMLDALRGRFANRHRRVGLRLPKQAN